VSGILTWPGEADESPFRRQLVEGQTIRSPKGRLRMFQGDPRFVVRLVPSLQLAAVPGLLAISRELHAELEALGVALPPRLYVVGSRHHDGAPQGFVVARTVIGRDAPADGRSRRTIAAQGDALCVALLGYYEGRYDRGGRVVSDIRLDQFVFGEIDDEPPRLWFVDLDPGFVEIERRTTQPIQLARLHWRIAEMANMIAGLEAMTGTELPAARAEINRLLDSEMFGHPTAAARPAILARVLADGETFDGGQWVQEQIGG
jgi:hypothetical protein